MTEPHRLAKYDIVARIAQGGMGNVYLARSSALAGFSKLVVVKTLRSDFAEDPKFCEMFLDEARLAARLNHRNVVQTNDAGVDDGTYFMVMDYLDGRNLWRIQKQYAKEGEKLPLAVSVRILADMLAGLHHAHELADFDGKNLGVVHRDVCPANVFVTIDGQVKVVDFGVAKAKNHSHETQAGTIKGRVVYMSPEHVSGKSIDRRADVFSAGIMLWEALEGTRYWDGLGEAQVLGRLLSGELGPAPTAAHPELLRTACTRALAHAAEDRYPTAHAMRLALEEWLEHNEQRNGLADLGAKIKEITASERARIAELLEEAAAAKPTDQLPALEPTGASTLSALVGESSISSGPVRPPAPSMSGVSSVGVPSLSGAGIPSSPPTATNPTVTATTTPSLPPPAPESSAKKLWPFAATAALVLVVFSAWLVLRASDKGAASQAPAVPATSLAVVVPPPAQTAAPTQVPVAQVGGDVTLDVAISPLSAKVFLDDRPLGANPFHGQLAKDGKEHVLRAEAAGFKPRAFSFVLDRDRAIDFTLEGYAVGGRGASPVATARTGTTGTPGKPGDPATPTSEPTGMRELPLKDHDTPKPQLDTDVFRKP